MEPIDAPLAKQPVRQIPPAPGPMAELLGAARDLLDKDGEAIWVIAALSVATLAIILWKLWRYS